MQAQVQVVVVLEGVLEEQASVEVGVGMVGTLDTQDMVGMASVEVGQGKMAVVGMAWGQVEEGCTQVVVEGK